MNAWQEVGESYLLEAFVGMPLFDFVAGSLDGEFEAGIYVFTDPTLELELTELAEAYTERLVALVRALCEKTPVESFFVGCSWSCNSLLGPALWRRWDKPGIAAMAREVHWHGRLLHVHFHGRCMETLF